MFLDTTIFPSIIVIPQHPSCVLIAPRCPYCLKEKNVFLNIFQHVFWPQPSLLSFIISHCFVVVPNISSIIFSLFTSLFLILSMFLPFHHCSYCSSPPYIILNIILAWIGCTFNPKKNHSNLKVAPIWDVLKVNTPS